MFQMLVKLYLIVMSPQDKPGCGKNSRYLSCKYPTSNTTKAADLYYRHSVQKLLFNDWYFIHFLAQMISGHQRVRASDYKNQYWLFYPSTGPVMFSTGSKCQFTSSEGKKLHIFNSSWSRTDLRPLWSRCRYLKILTGIPIMEL